MALNFEVSFHHFEPTELIRAKIDEQISQLEKFQGAIVSGRVVVEGAHRHGHKTVVEIRVELKIPGAMAIGKREAEFPSPAGQRTFDKALTEAFQVATRQMKAHVDKMRPHEVKDLKHQDLRGRVGKLNRTVSNGFVEMPDGVSLFFAKEVLDGEFEHLAEGDEVLVKVAATESPYGPQCSWVKPMAPMLRRG